jgi:putative ABC transport system permease protein
MSRTFYGKLAWNGIRKNKRFYTPYILTCVGMVMMFYIVSHLSTSQLLKEIKGGEVMESLLNIGVGVISVFALIFLFYTNSFLTRRRQKEFGLYNVLGMGKRNLAHILVWESVIIYVISVLAGLAAGLIFSKFAELAMVNIMRGKTSFSMHVSPVSILETVILFAVIFFLILLNSLRQIHLANPIELLRSENVGEKPPKANWFLAFLGAVILIAAYDLAVSMEDPMEAMIWFFVAVVMVIIATYLLFIAGSVTVCRLLQKKKNYYYQTRHFVSVSSMVYRMKRNGAGLASICILCTMILVTLSSTLSLYIGAEDNIRLRYPRDLSLTVTTEENLQEESGKMQSIRQLVAQTEEEYQVTEEDTLDYQMAVFTGYVTDDQIITDVSNEAKFQNLSTSIYGDIWQIYVVSLEDYNRLMNQEESLDPDEVLIYTTKSKYENGTVAIENMEPLKVKKQVTGFRDYRVDGTQIFSTLYIFVPDYDQMVDTMLEQMAFGDGTLNAQLEMQWFYGMNLDIAEDKQIQMQEDLDQKLEESNLLSRNEILTWEVESLEKERGSFYALYGGLFYLGILLGIVFVFATVLMMYYKQISEGYEDQARFEIMQKVGMTKKDIRHSINAQILMVFFLPLIVAGVHLGFAFPLIRKMLLLFGLVNLKLLILVTIGAFLVFALCYIIVYVITSKAYYNIVSGEISTRE